MKTETPASYTEIVIKTVKEYSFYLWAAASVFFILNFLLSVATLIHIEIVEIAVFSRVEMMMGETLAEGVYMPGLIANIAVVGTTAVASLHSAWMSGND